MSHPKEPPHHAADVFAEQHKSAPPPPPPPPVAATPVTIHHDLPTSIASAAPAPAVPAAPGSTHHEIKHETPAPAANTTPGSSSATHNTATHSAVDTFGAHSATAVAAGSALHQATDARLAQSSADQLSHGSHPGATKAPDPDHTPAPATGPGSTNQTTAGANAALAAAESAVHNQAAQLEAFGANLSTADPGHRGVTFQSAADRVHQGDHHPGQSDTVAAASSDPNDGGKGAGAFASLTESPRQQLQDATHAPGSDEVTAALTGLFTEQVQSGHATSPSVAIGGPTTLVDHDAITLLEEEKPLEITDIIKRPSGTLVDGAAETAAAETTEVAGASAAEVAVDAVVGAGVFVLAVAAAGAVGVAIGLKFNDDHKEGEKAVTQAAADLLHPTDSKEETERKAEAARQAGAARKAEHDKAAQEKADQEKADQEKAAHTTPGVSLTDPNSDEHPPTPAQIAFALALQHAAHITHNPGNVDPSREGDPNASGHVNTGVLLANTGRRGEESKVGNPVTIDHQIAAAGDINQRSPIFHQVSGGPNDGSDGIVTGDGLGGNLGHAKADGPETLNVSGSSAPLIGVDGAAAARGDSSDQDSSSTHHDSSDSGSGTVIIEDLHEFQVVTNDFGVPDHITVPDD